MADKDYGQNLDKDQFGRSKQHSVFDDDVIDDVDSVQEPYPVNDVDDEKEIENPDTDERVHEYEDNDHPHEYRPPSAVIDDYQGVSSNDGTNAFEQQNPLQ